MSYTKITTSFKDHETVLTAAHLQHLEKGIADNDIALGNRVRTDTNVQGLDTSQKRNARTNIDVPSTEEMTAAVTAESDFRSAADESLENKTNTIQEELNKAKTRATNLSAVSSSMVNLKTIRANPVIITDALAGDVQKLVIQLAPKRDLHGYDKPWVGGSDVNLLQNGGVFDTTVNGIRFTSDGNGSYTISGTATADAAYDFNINETVFPSTVYLHFLNNAATFNVAFVFINGTTQVYAPTPNVINRIAEVSANLGGKTVTKLRLFVSNGATVNIALSPMMCTDNTVKAFVPYSNICPITGYDCVDVVRTGKNLLDADAVGDVTTGNGTRQGVKFSRAGSYVISAQRGFSQNATIYITKYNGSSYESGLSLISSSVITSPRIITITDGQWFLVHGGSGVPKNIAQLMINECSVQVELGSTETTFEPYQGQTVSVNLSSVAGGMVYGGTVTINEDGSGTLVVDRAAIDMGTLSWSAATSISGLGGHYRYNAVVSGMSTVADKAYSCTEYSAITYAETQGGAIGIVNGYWADNTVRVETTLQSTAASFKTAMQGVTLVYPLATPSTYPLTASQVTTLLGYNRIYTNGDTLEVTYRTDKYATKDEAYAAFATDTASGAVASITDGADDIPLKTLTVAIEPKQDLHGYDKPWPGGAVKNLAKLSDDIVGNNQKSTVAYSDSGATITATGTYGRYGWLIPVTNGQTYTISFLGKASSDGTGMNPKAYFGSADGAWSTSETGYLGFVGIPTTASMRSFSFTASSNVLFFGIYVTSTSTSGNIEISNVQLELGSTATDYIPYSNICPISGWDSANVTRTGKNLLGQYDDYSNSFTVSDVTFTKVDGTHYKASGTSTSASWLPLRGNNNIIEINGNGKPGQYTSSAICSSGDSKIDAYIYYGDSVDTNLYVAQGKISVLDGEKLQGVRYIMKPNRTFSNEDVYLQLEVGSTATGYETPKSYKTLSVNLSDATGSTVYGGTLTINSDGSGTVVVDRAFKTLNGTENWYASTSTDWPSYGHVYQYQLNGVLGKADGGEIVSNLYEEKSCYWAVDYASIFPQFNNYIVVSDPAYTTLADFKAFLRNNHLQVVYKLATPITYTLTATQLRTLLGSNNVWCDAGKVFITYHTDIGILIKKLMNALTAYGITM